MTLTAVLPHLNAALNTISTILLIIAYVLIRQGRRDAHRRVMIAALIVSAVFLASYLLYHFTAPIFEFPGKGWVVPVYYAMLISHVILAAAATPLIAVTAWRGLKAWETGGGGASAEHYLRHRKIARWTYPIWLYVTVTGVLIYATLYHVYAPPG